MRRALVSVLVGLVLGAALAVGVGTLSDDVHAQAKPKTGDVILLRCSTTAPDLAVTAFVGSANTPGQKSLNCADNLSWLVRDGFALRDIGHYDDEKTGFVLYTLAR